MWYRRETYRREESSVSWRPPFPCRKGDSVDTLSLPGTSRRDLSISRITPFLQMTLPAGRTQRFRRGRLCSLHGRLALFTDSLRIQANRKEEYLGQYPTDILEVWPPPTEAGLQGNQVVGYLRDDATA